MYSTEQQHGTLWSIEYIMQLQAVQLCSVCVSACVMELLRMSVCVLNGDSVHVSVCVMELVCVCINGASVCVSALELLYACINGARICICQYTVLSTS